MNPIAIGLVAGQLVAWEVPQVRLCSVCGLREATIDNVCDHCDQEAMHLRRKLKDMTGI